MTLCNQGCGTHVYFKIVDGRKRPYNVLDKKKHDCPMLHMAKLWGGYYKTIPMGYIKEKIITAYEESRQAQDTRNIDDILRALTTTVDFLQYVVGKMELQEEQNTKWGDELESYKKKLVEDQRRRDEEKRDTK